MTADTNGLDFGFLDAHGNARFEVEIGLIRVLGTSISLLEKVLLCTRIRLDFLNWLFRLGRGWIRLLELVEISLLGGRGDFVRSVPALFQYLPGLLERPLSLNHFLLVRVIQDLDRLRITLELISFFRRA